MNKNITGIFTALAGLVLITACSKEKLRVYEDKAPALYFTSPTYSYSFMTDMDSTSKVIYLPVRLSGALNDQDRKFSVEIVNDTNTTALKEWFEIRDGWLPKNAINGSIAIVLKRNVTIDTSIIKLKLRLAPSSVLDTVPNSNIQITWTGKIIQPVNWRWLRFYFGTPFSTRWYKFMVDVTGQQSFPYDPTLAASDPKTWWMSAAQIQAYGLQVKEALQKYNIEHPTDPLRHDDGTYKNELVSMP